MKVKFLLVDGNGCNADDDVFVLFFTNMELVVDISKQK